MIVFREQIAHLNLLWLRCGVHKQAQKRFKLLKFKMVQFFPEYITITVQYEYTVLSYLYSMIDIVALLLTSILLHYVL